MLAKSKLNSIETLVSQALVDMEISHKEYIVILKEKDKYERMKENLRSENKKQEIMRLSSIKSKTLVKNYWVFYSIKKKLFFSCVCTKWFKSAKKGIKKVNRKDLEIEPDVANWAQIFDKCDSEKTKIQTRINA